VKSRCRVEEVMGVAVLHLLVEETLDIGEDITDEKGSVALETLMDRENSVRTEDHLHQKVEALVEIGPSSAVSKLSQCS
jgi:hypothetical protein